MQLKLNGKQIIGCLVLSWAGLLGNARAGDEEIMFAEIPTVYAAARHEQPVAQAPAAVSVITRDDIRKYGYRTLGQALASVPGLYLSNDREYEQIGARGMNIPGDFNVRVLFLLNGLPLNDKYFGLFLPELTPDLLDAVERIEIVKGPASTLFGSDAIFATVNIVTRTGADLDGHAVVSAASGFDPFGRGVFTYGNQFTNGLDLFMSGHYEYAAGEPAIAYGSHGTAFDQDRQRLADAFVSARYQDFFFQAWYADRQKDFPGIPFDTRDGQVRDSWAMTELRWDTALAPDKRLMARVFFEDYPYQYAAHYRQTGDPALYFLTEHTDDSWVGCEAQFNWQPLESHQLTLGTVFEHHWTLLRGQTDANGLRSSTYPGTTDDFFYTGVYVQEEWRIIKPLALTVGGRYDAFPDMHRDRFSPRVALVWSATDRTTVKAIYGQAFRAPSEFEISYYAGSGNGAANTRIRPENINTYELVLEENFRHDWTGRLSVFHNEVDNVIALQNATPAFYDNDYDVRTTGVEAELTKRFASGVRGFINGTFQDSALHPLRPPTATTQLINSPAWIGNLGLIWPICGDKFAVALRENCSSARQTATPGVKTAGACLTDLTLSSENALPNWGFILSVVNLFDERFNFPSSPGSVVDSIPQPGRQVVMRVSYRF